MATQRQVEVEWIGGLMDGEGKIMSTTSGALPELEVTWDARERRDRAEDEPGGAARGGARVVLRDAARAGLDRRRLGARR